MSVFTRLAGALRRTQLFGSIFRHGLPRERRGRSWAVLSNFFLHVHPVSIRKSGLQWWFTWGLGGLTFYLFLVELVTGILLMFYYRPVPEFAYRDVQDMRAVMPFGLLREVHRWGAHAMVITVWLHMLRVFLTGSYKPPREFNWVIGVGLLVLTMLLSFTGYLLPWDQLAYWAVTVASHMAGAAPWLGHEGPGAALLSAGGVPLVHDTSDVRYALLASSAVGPATLLRFYVLHCIALPVLTALLIGVHFWRIRKDGGLSGPP